MKKTNSGRKKTWAGRTEKRWMEEIRWVHSTHLYSDVSKWGMFHRWRNTLLANDEWETFPAGIKLIVNLHALLYEEAVYINAGENRKKAIKMEIEQKENEIKTLRKILTGGEE